MLKQRHEQIQFMVRLTDVLVCIAAFFAAYLLRSSGLFSRFGGIGSAESHVWMLAASIVIHFLVYPAAGFYQSLRLKTVADIIAMVVRAAAVEFVVLGSLVFLFQAKTTSRYFVVFFLAINYGLILIEKIGVRTLLTSLRRRGYNYRHVLIVGTGENAARVVASLKRNKHWGYVPAGLLRPSARKEADGDVAREVPVLGELSELRKVIENRPVDEVYFAPDYLDAAEVREQVQLCESLGLPVRFSLSFFDLPKSRVTFSTLDEVPVLTFYTTLMTPAEAFLKRLIDIMVAIIGLIITVVIGPWIAWKIKRQSPGPIIFKQVRVGENGRRFKCYKFRTMYLDAEERKKELLAENQMQGPIFKIENDPRIFPFGAFLRKTSLDELPQFFNILRGDMSVVGTRPPTPDEVNQYETYYRRRLSIRPGLTGLWQVSGRNNIRRFEDILELDLQYIDQWSIWLDIRIIFRTIWITLFRRGAY